MAKQYIVQEDLDKKHFKDIPYIKKKEFKENDSNMSIGTTVLKKLKNNNDDYDLLLFENEKYIVKEKYFGKTKGYVEVGDNTYITLKKRIPFLLLLFLFLLLIILLLLYFHKPEPPTPITDNKPVNIVNPKPEPEVIEDSKPTENDESNIENKKPTNSKKENPPTKEETKEPEIINYKIDFNSNGGTGKMDSIDTTEKQVQLAPNNFELKGYTFDGWSTSKDGDVVYQDEDTIDSLSESMILYAHWKINQYSITFQDYDGTILVGEILDFGKKIILPEEPKRNGYIFDGWDKNLDKAEEDVVVSALYKINNYDISYILHEGILENPIKEYTVESETFTIDNPTKKGYTFEGWNQEKIKDYTIEKGTTGDINLEANYSPNHYYINIDSNGGNEKYEPKEVIYDSKIGELPQPTKDGYTFDGWYKGDNPISSDDKYDDAGDITITAKWKVISYKISYKLNGGTLNNPIKEYNVESETFTIDNPVKEGYTFEGWNQEKIKDYTIEKGTTGNISLEANYSPITYTIIYNSNGGTGDMETDTIKYDEQQKLKKNNFTYLGKNFIGWSTSKDGKVVYKEEDLIKNLTTENNAQITLYASWENIKYSVKYYDWDNTLVKDSIAYYGDKISPPEMDGRGGYTFAGWTPNADTITSDMEYHIVYNANTYTITYDTDKGILNNPISEYNIESNDFTLPQPTRTGYTFIGWSGSNGLRPQIEVTIKKGTIGNKEYKANWEANKYNINLNPNNGSVNSTSVQVSYDSTYGILPTPSRRGYTFEGWYYNKDLIEEHTVMTKDSDHELKADWKVIDYDITYNLNGGNISSPKTKYNIETDTFTLVNPTRIGYNFIGWTGSNGNTPSTNVKIEKGTIGNKEYSANWEVINYSISYNLDGGSISSQPTSYNIESQTFTLPQPTRTGYTFVGWIGTDVNTATKNLSVAKGSIGNRSYTATWTKNYYTVNYYVNGNLWSQRSVGYNDSLPNLNGQDALDGYHKFHGWNGWVNNMPDHDVSLTASITECYCRLTTGHGPIGNANGLLSVFQSAGWTGRVQEQTLYPGNYLVITDYTLTRNQAEAQKNYIASHTNYTNYNFPYLYWVAIDCTNGYAEAWTRGLGQSQFN